MRKRGPFKLGDTVTLSAGARGCRTTVQPGGDLVPTWDGTVVDVIADQYSPLFRVYWRYPLGRVHDYRSDELVRR